FEVDVPRTAVVVEGDEARPTQVFSNLLNNAAKYTRPGGHLLLGLTVDAGEVVVTVRDDGNGIGADLLPRVFDLFVQGQQGMDRSSGGLGIGLAVVSSLVKLHGGTVSASSAGPEQGSTFVVRLPALEAGSSTAESAPPPALRAAASTGRRVVIVDDNQDALSLAAEALRALGNDVRTAADGPSGLRLVTAWKPHVAILDIGLPVMDGYELAARIRAEMSDTAPHLIALTGYGQPNDRERSFAAGFRTHLVKPVDIQQLANAVAD
ncbi:MAG TPA: ATP-binding protein, partial [Myxococcales bacterium]|nr:ATP-binding protein [Myxococcales bacterium]